VLGANKNKLPKGNRKDSGKEVCFRTHFSLSSVKEIQRERDGRASGRLQVSRLSSNTFKTCRLNSNLHCSELEIYWKCGRVLMDWSKDIKGFISVLLSLGNVVHSDNWWRELIRLLLHTEGGCLRVSQIQYLGCHSPQISSRSSIKLICNCSGMMLTSLMSNRQSPPSCPSLMLFKWNRVCHELQ